MSVLQPAAPAASTSSTVVVDLIGDLDATLGSTFAAALAHLTERGTTDVFVTTRHVAVSSHDGLAALGAACADARERGCAIALESGNRRMRAALRGARIVCDAERAVAPPASGRHLMIARHAPTKRLAQTA